MAKKSNRKNGKIGITEKKIKKTHQKVGNDKTIMIHMFLVNIFLTAS